MPGGTRSFEMAKRLVEFGNEVNMVTTRRDGHASKQWQVTDEQGIKVHWLSIPYNNSMNYNERIKAFLQFATRSAAYASRLCGDILFATSTPLTIALPGVYISKKKRIPMVFEVRDLWPEIPIALGAIKGPLVYPAMWLEKFAYRNSKMIVALSPGMKEGIMRTGFSPERIHVIPNSADLDMFNVPESQGIGFRNQFRWLGSRPLIVYTGAFGKINGVDYLVDLAAVFLSKQPEICFLAVGEGSEKEKILSRAKERGVLEKNFYMLSPIPKKNMPAVLSAADMTTSLCIDMPQLWANSANKFFDALASGTPIAINYNGWQAELIHKSGSGIVLDHYNLEIASEQLLAILKNETKLKAASIAARQLAKDQFSRDALAKRLELVLMMATEKE